MKNLKKGTKRIFSLDVAGIRHAKLANDDYYQYIVVISCFVSSVTHADKYVSLLYFYFVSLSFSIQFCLYFVHASFYSPPHCTLVRSISLLFNSLLSVQNLNIFIRVQWTRLLCKRLIVLPMRNGCKIKYVNHTLWTISRYFSCFFVVPLSDLNDIFQNSITIHFTPCNWFHWNFR